MALSRYVSILIGSAVPVPIGLSKLVHVMQTELLSLLTERDKSLLPELSLEKDMTTLTVATLSILRAKRQGASLRKVIIEPQSSMDSSSENVDIFIIAVYETGRPREFAS